MRHLHLNSIESFLENPSQNKLPLDIVRHFGECLTMAAYGDMSAFRQMTSATYKPLDVTLVSGYDLIRIYFNISNQSCEPVIGDVTSFIVKVTKNRGMNSNFSDAISFLNEKHAVIRQTASALGGIYTVSPKQANFCQMAHLLWAYACTKLYGAAGKLPQHLHLTDSQVTTVCQLFDFLQTCRIEEAQRYLIKLNNDPLFAAAAAETYDPHEFLLHCLIAMGASKPKIEKIMLGLLPYLMLNYKNHSLFNYFPILPDPSVTTLASRCHVTGENYSWNGEGHYVGELRTISSLISSYICEAVC